MDKQQTGASVQERRTKFIINCAYAALIAAIVYLVFRYAIYTLMPFVVAFIVASIAKPLVRLLTEKCRFGRSLASVLVLVLLYGVIGVLLTLLIVQLVTLVRDFVVAAPELYTTQIAPALTSFFENLQKNLDKLDPAIMEFLNNASSDITSELGSAISNVSVKLAGSLTKFAGSLPSALVSVLISVIASFFMTVDYNVITAFILKQLPQHAADVTVKVREGLGSTLIEYIRSYALIMLITFGELFIGLMLVGYANAWAIALIIAIFDILPIVGSGLIMFPWALITLIQGDIAHGLGLAALWLFIIVVRNIIEPRIIGKNVGLHPVVTLMAMVIGTALFGGLGLFLLPISLAIIKRLHDQGVIGVYRSLTDEEMDKIKPKRKKKALAERVSARRKTKNRNSGSDEASENPESPADDASSPAEDSDVTVSDAGEKSGDGK